MKPHDESQIITILKALKKRFPQNGAMEFGEAYHSIIGVILSARTRDEQVLKLLPDFFRRFPTVYVLSSATEKDIIPFINSIGMYKQKAKHLKKFAQRIVDVYDGKIPNTMEDLTSLAGVGRKTASVILPYIYKKPAIAVDTHVHRVTNRLEWAKAKTPPKTEVQLLEVIPKKHMPTVNQVFVKFGRYICLPGKPRCWACPIKDMCPYKHKELNPPKDSKRILDRIDAQEAEIKRLKQTIEDVL